VGIVRRVSRIGVVVILAALATGCIVLPYGRGHGRHGGGDRHYAPVSESQPIGGEAVRERPRQGTR
jgi:hypothetical protein